MTISTPQSKVYKAESRLDVPFTDLLSWIFGRSEIHDPDRPLYVDALNPERKLTYSQCRTTIRQLIKGLRALGVQKGDCVCMHTYNIYYPLIFLAVIGAGAVFIGSNPGYKELELMNLVQTSKASLIITAPDFLPTVRHVTKLLQIPDSNILLFTGSQNVEHGFLSWEILFDYGEDDWIRFDDHKMANETPACLVTTSGTTGLPKMAVLSHHAWVALNAAIEDEIPKPYDVKRLVFLPMFHTFAAPLSHLSPLRSAHAAYVMPRFSMSQMVNAVEKFGINELLLVPPMIVDFVSSAADRTRFLRNIRYIFCGGAPLDSVTIKKLYDLLAPGACLAQVYGMTEAGWIATTKWPERNHTGSVGKLLSNGEAQLIDCIGNAVHEPGVRGEIFVRGPRLMTGYYNNPEATAQSFVNGWLRTGDVGTIDENGQIYIVDRQKDLIKVRGWQVSPAELEAVLRAHPLILDAAVIGVPYKNSEAPKALVVRKSDSVSEEDVKLYIATLLVGYKHLDGGVCFLDSIPKSPSGYEIKTTKEREMQTISLWRQKPQKFTTLVPCGVPGNYNEDFIRQHTFF